MHNCEISQYINIFSFREVNNKKSLTILRVEAKAFEKYRAAVVAFISMTYLYSGLKQTDMAGGREDGQHRLLSLWALVENKKRMP